MEKAHYDRAPNSSTVSTAHGGSCRQWLFWWCVHLDGELREDNTSPHNGYCADNFRARHFILQDDSLLSGKSLSQTANLLRKVPHRVA